MIRADKKLEATTSNLLKLFDDIEDIYKKTHKAFSTWSSKKALEVCEDEKEINMKTSLFYNELIEYIAMFSPVGTNLRKVIVDIQIATDLERASDYAQGLAKVIINNDTFSEREIKHILKILKYLIEMFKSTKKAFLEDDIPMLLETAKIDQKINKLYKKALNEIHAEKSKNNEELFTSYFVFKKLERCGDHIKNIIEQMIFAKNGELFDL